VEYGDRRGANVAVNKIKPMMAKGITGALRSPRAIFFP